MTLTTQVRAPSFGPKSVMQWCPLGTDIFRKVALLLLLTCPNCACVIQETNMAASRRGWHPYTIFLLGLLGLATCSAEWMCASEGCKGRSICVQNIEAFDPIDKEKTDLV